MGDDDEVKDDADDSIRPLFTLCESHLIDTLVHLIAGTVHEKQFATVRC